MRLLPVFAAALVLAACAGTSPSPVDQSAAPLAPPGAGPSVIAIPLRVDPSALREAVDAALPIQFSADQDWQPQGDAGIKFAWQREPVQIHVADDSSLVVETTVHYQMRVAAHFAGSYKELTQCGYGETEPTLEHVGLSLRLSAAADWSLTPVVSVIETVPGKHCKVVLGLDPSLKIANLIHDRLQQKLDGAQQRFSAGLDLSKQAAAAWGTLSQAHTLGGSQPGYFMLNPSAASLGPLSADADGAMLVIGLTAEPIVAIGVPPQADPLPLPPLDNGAPVPALHIVLPIQIPYASLEQVLAQQLVGQVYTLGQDREQVQRVQVTGSPRAITVRVEMSGTSADVLTLSGAAVYDAAADTLSLGKLDYTLETQNRLQLTEEWLLHSRLREDLQAKAELKIADRLDTLKAALQPALNRPLGAHAALAGSLQDIKPLGVVLSDAYLTLYFVAEGALTVDVH